MNVFARLDRANRQAADDAQQLSGVAIVYQRLFQLAPDLVSAAHDRDVVGMFRIYRGGSRECRRDSNPGYAGAFKGVEADYVNATLGELPYGGAAMGT